MASQSAEMSFLRRPTTWIVVGAAAAALVWGWQLFWFLTDDAFIAFRYVSNGVAGLGYVWNPPPFAAVEGYTSFLWVALLDLAWRLTGTAPPVAANWLSLAFGLGSIWLVLRFAARMALPGRPAWLRSALLALVLLGTVSNRSFLAWLSSGLETAMFNFFLTAWLYFALSHAKRLTGLCLATVGCALTRPDGLLFFGATAVLIVIGEWRTEGSSAARVKRLAPTLVLAAVPLHLLLRRVTYGEWLPNTYYAKVVSPWPESGIRYLFSFVLEYGVWVWLAIAGAWAVHAVLRRQARASPEAIVAIAALALHFGYYTFVVGGDHFEYRVYSHLVPLLFLSAMWMLTRLSRTSLLPIAALASFVLASWPIPWTHFALTHELRGREGTYKLVVPVAPHMPAWLAPLVEPWDDAQRWLIERLVCLRHQEHKVFYEQQRDFLPPRAEGSKISWDQRPVLLMQTIGVAGWVLPNVAIIDYYGLNDRVIARNPPTHTGERLMAHDRQPPPGYARCFRPNVWIEDRRAKIRRRARPLRDAEIRACEARSW